MKDKKRQKSVSPNKNLDSNEETITILKSVEKMKSSEVGARSSEGECSIQMSEIKALQNNKGNTEGKGQDAKGENAWLRVSPAKTGRTPTVSTLVKDDVVISASKFSVLSMDVVEEGEILVVEKSKEEDTNVVGEDT